MIKERIDGQKVTVVIDNTTGYDVACSYEKDTNGQYKVIEGTYKETENGNNSSLTHFPGSSEAVTGTSDEYSILTNSSLKVAVAEIAPFYSASFTVKPDLGEGANNMDVKVDVTFSGGSTLKFVFSDPSGDCVMSFTAEAQLDENTSVGEGVAVEGSQSVADDAEHPGRYIRTWKITRSSSSIKDVSWTTSDIKKTG